MDQCKTAVWGKKGGLYAASLNIPEPMWRFTTEATMGTKPKKVGKGVYGIAEAAVRPTEEKLYKSLLAYAATKQYETEMALVRDAYVHRLAKIVQGEPKA